MDFKVLDVGCGYDPKGDVNVDRFLGDVHRGSHTGKNRLIPQKIRNFILADAQFLPFKDDSFDDVLSDNVIEHLPDPSSFIRECIRIAKTRVIIICPHRMGLSAKAPCHIHFFSARSFIHGLQKFRFDCEIVTWRYFPSRFLPLFRLPEQIRITIYVCQRKGRS